MDSKIIMATETTEKSYRGSKKYVFGPLKHQKHTYTTCALARETVATMILTLKTDGNEQHGTPSAVPRMQVVELRQMHIHQRSAMGAFAPLNLRPDGAGMSRIPAHRPEVQILRTDNR